jgi:hypothetical protein
MATTTTTNTLNEKLATTTLAEDPAPSPDFSKYDYKNLEPYVHPPETKEKFN